MFKIFKIVFCMLEFFLALFPFYKKNTKNIFWVFNPLGKIIWTSFRANFWLCTIFSKNLKVEEAPGRRGAPRGPPWGRPTQGKRLLGPTFSNGYLTVVPGSSSGALAQIPLNRGRERGDELSCSLSPLSLPLTHSCSGFLWILTQVWLQEHSLSLNSLMQDWSHFWRNNFRVSVSFSFH